MRKSDVVCPECGCGYRRIEVTTCKGTKGQYRCLLCDHLIEVFDGSTEVAIRLTVQPGKIFSKGRRRSPFALWSFAATDSGCQNIPKSEEIVDER
jgi:hypothetical protein